MEVSFKVELLISEIIDERSLLDEIVFSVDSAVFELFLGGLEVLELFLFGDVGPLVAELLRFVGGVDVVPDSELGSEEESEMSDLDVAEEERKEILVVPDHGPEPFVVVPASEARN